MNADSILGLLGCLGFFEHGGGHEVLKLPYHGNRAVAMVVQEVLGRTEKKERYGLSTDALCLTGEKEDRVASFFEGDVVLPRFSFLGSCSLGLPMELGAADRVVPVKCSRG